jgi:hypothetical protein
MKTTVRVRANRRNAALSTGPRSKAGKARVARNAVRHGLAVPLTSLHTFDATVERLAILLVGDSASDERLDRARYVAEAQVDLIRVRRARDTLLAAPMADPDYLRTRQMAPYTSAMLKSLARWGLAALAESLVPLSEAERVAAVIGDRSKELHRLDRYERRALSRLRSAVRALDALALPAPRLPLAD